MGSNGNLFNSLQRGSNGFITVKTAFPRIQWGPTFFQGGGGGGGGGPNANFYTNP